MHIIDDPAIEYLKVIMWARIQTQNVQSSIVPNSQKSGSNSKTHQRRVN